MATLLPAVGTRDVCKCDRCRLVQFVPRAGLSAPCKRCHVALDFVPQPPPPALVPTHQMTCAISARLPGAIRAQRLRIGLSQRQIAVRLAGPRTYVSKLENGKAAPTLPSLLRVAEAIETTVADLLRAAASEQDREAEVRALMKDQFIAALLPHVSQLSDQARRIVISKVSAMAAARLPHAAFAALVRSPVHSDCHVA